MLESLVIAGIIAAPLGSAGLFLPARRHERVLAAARYVAVAWYALSCRSQDRKPGGRARPTRGARPMRWMDRWVARAQRKSDERTARWQERQQEKVRSGRTTVTDRWMARAQRKSDERTARWQQAYALRQLVPSGPVEGPGGSEVFVSVEQTGLWWLRRAPLALPAGGGGGTLTLACLLISEAIWWLVFRRTYTVHVRTNDHPPVKIHVRLSSEEAAYRAAAQLVSHFQDRGPAALLSWQADVTASIQARGAPLERGTH